MEEQDVILAAQFLAKAWVARRDLAEMPPGSLTPRSREDAYRIQDHMALLTDETVAGWKFGATSPAVMRQDGHSGPVVGRIFDSCLYQSPARIKSSDIPYARVEGEFVVRFLKSFPPRAASYQTDEIVENITVLPALEIIGNRYPKPLERKLTTFEEIADNGTGWALVIGQPIDDWQGVDIQNLEIVLRVDGGPVQQNYTGEDRCVPLQVATDCVNMMSERNIGITAGQVVSTGGCTAPISIKIGSHVTADFCPFGMLSFVVTD